MVKCCRNMNFEDRILSLQQEKMMGFDNCQEYLNSISTRYYYGSVEKQLLIQLSFSV